MTFLLIWPGCAGEAVDQIGDAMGYHRSPATVDEDEDNHLQLVWEETTRRMLDAYDGEMGAPMLKIGNSIWFDDGNELNEDYAEVVGDYARQVDFDAVESSSAVNDWVQKSTDGLIKSIVQEGAPLRPPHSLLAINSIYLW